MLLVIDLTKKKPGFRDALVAYTETQSFRTNGGFLEYGNPDIRPGVIPEDEFNRIYIIDETHICAKIDALVIEDDKASFSVSPYGPLADKVLPDVEYALAARTLSEVTGRVDLITTFDLIPAVDHVEYVEGE